MESNVISSIIGFWRMGADIYQIEGITGVHPNNINSCIKKHKEINDYKEFLEKLKTIKKTN